jgi:hypothetical protein
MKKLIVVIAALALPASAPAKELRSAQVCGPDGCTQVEDKQALVAAFEDGGPPSSPPNRSAPFYRVELRIKGDPAVETMLISPKLRRARGFDRTTWFSIPDRHLATWVRATRDVRPFPAAKLPNVDPSAPAPTTGGALAPQTYRAEPLPPSRATDEGNDVAWWLPAVIATALGAGALLLLARRRRPDAQTG